MRMVYFFYSKNNAPVGSNVPWNPKTRCDSKYTNEDGFVSEGTYWLFHRMLEEHIIDDILVIIESAKGPGVGYFNEMKGYVVPEITQAHQFIKQDDILHIRGGFRSWHNFLTEHYMDKWKILYGANTGRERWTWWDIIFDDLREKNQLDGNERLWLHYQKPTHPKIFHPIKNSEQKYDICVGASHIHDKKGQWFTIEVLDEYRKKYGKNLKAVMPGGRIGHGVFTNKIHKIMPHLQIEHLPFVSRNVMCNIYNKSKLFCHFGGGGQNDRGPLEAMRCGCPVAMTTPSRHAPVTYKNMNVSYIMDDKKDKKQIATELHVILNHMDKDIRKNTFNWHEEKSSIEHVILPWMDRLFSFLKKHPKPNLEMKKKLLKEMDF